MSRQVKESKEAEVERQLEAIIGRTHQLLSSNFTFVSETRELDERENALLLELDRNSTKYKQLAGALAIDSYIGYLVSLLSGCEPLLEITAILFDHLSQARQLAAETDAEALADNMDQTWLHLCKLAEITHKLFPRSPLVDVHRKFMDGVGGDPSDTIYGRLYQENLELREKLEQNDRQVLELELKLTKLLQEHDGCEGKVDSSLRMLELREQLAAKEEQIESMNEEFSIEIDKYNTVYDAMKKEIEELRDYREIDLVEMVERLETEIVKLREEKERDEIIIRQMRERTAPSPYMVSPRKGTYSRVVYY